MRTSYSPLLHVACDEWDMNEFCMQTHHTYPIANNQLTQHSARKVYYFCYGSNMNGQRMNDRGINYHTRAIGYLHNYILLFNKSPTNIPQHEFVSGVTGGFATIKHIDHESKSCSSAAGILGIVYEVCENDLNKLDVYEGVAQNHYYRHKVNVHTINGECVSATTYIACDSSCSDIGLIPPSEYLQHLLCGHDLLPASYIDKLRALPTTNQPLPAYLKQGNSAIQSSTDTNINTSATTAHANDYAEQIMRAQQQINNV